MKKIIYSLVFIIFIFLIYNFINREILKSSSINKKVLIIYKRCSKSSKGGSKSLIKIKFMNKTYPVSVNRINCEKVKLKDSINLLYSVKGDRFFFKN